ncbi:enolase-phosphatase E1 [Eremomyces bilateralis CBS 781.70]|uniref:Enolase-phosphatase E1 n=1 Tax=Eremomyces bilateralis CBS 781.70 TaxID=1392243 RepID=A0A6G1FWD8_9PEZI|nr:enolase-phosphatase E1 [Eremomyces bilateralis CBS 781.70]KAF1810012.1 enolase-phosphatase E1 [Eremomyces bilateralis CBS 781.70]
MKIEGVEVVLLDIEGTILPIDFVKKELYPYALRGLPKLLDQHFKKPIPALVEPIALFPPEVRRSPADLYTHLHDLTEKDIKHPGLKQLQGHVWRQGYRDGVLRARLFPDVKPAFDRWAANGKTLAIYSSGSVQAQRLLFQHVEDPENPGPDTVKDYEGYFDQNYFDTQNAGMKAEQVSYVKIAAALGKKPESILFLSDSDKEVLAAKLADMQSVLVQRPGNPEQDMAALLDVVGTFDELNLV